MKNLPILNVEEIERQQLQQRISLARRPSLGFTLAHLDGVASKLAASNFDRERFVNDPRGYLGEQMVPVASGELVVGVHVQTSEVCTAIAACVAAVVAVGVVFFAGFFQVAAIAQAYLTVQAATQCWNETVGKPGRCSQNQTSFNYSYQSPTQLGFIGTL